MQRTHIDDEYARAGEVDPRVLVTTSRDPSSRLAQFAKELKVLIPNAQRLNRGTQVCVATADKKHACVCVVGRALVLTRNRVCAQCMLP